MLRWALTTTLTVGVSMAIALLTANSVAFASGIKLTQSQAATDLNRGGIGWLSSGNCVQRSNSHCTSYDQINSGTVNGVLALQRASGCRIVIAGGTEVGHAAGPKSHYAGYKVDISHNACIDYYVTHSFRPQRPTFGSSQYVSSVGNVYTDEGNHWDVLFQ